MSRLCFLSVLVLAIPAVARAQSPPWYDWVPLQSLDDRSGPKVQQDDLPKTAESNSANVLERLRPKFEVRGRIEADTILAAQSDESQAAIGNLQNGYGFRRVRLGAQGTVDRVGHWVSEVELAGGSVSLRDVFIGLRFLPWFREVRVGHFREPFSLEGATSSNFITFMENSPLNVLDPARNWGGRRLLVAGR